MTKDDVPVGLGGTVSGRWLTLLLCLFLLDFVIGLSESPEDCVTSSICGRVFSRCGGF